MPDFKTVKIPLPAPIPDHKGPVTEIIIREPTFSEYMRIGDPYEIGESPDTGVRYSIQQPEAVMAYLEVCLVQPSDRSLLEKLGVQVARKVHAAILGFFQAGAVETATDAGSTTSPTT